MDRKNDRDRDRDGHRGRDIYRNRDRRNDDRRDYYGRDRRSRSRSRERYHDKSWDRTRDRDEGVRGHVNYRDRSQRENHKYRKDEKHSPKSRYDLPTTESLHAKKLAALDHEKFLIDRQKERQAKGKVEGLWPKTPPRAEFYFGDVLNVVEDEVMEEAEEVKEVVIVESSDKVATVKSDDSSDEIEMNIKVKAPSASKPSINTFSTSKPTKYGGDLMPGEGDAMAGFIAQGQRIPRRGEIGLDSDQITRFESAGYVMSGSRHHLMNAVRMRKENQVISAEEKRMVAQMALEERVKREEEIVKTFKAMVEEKMKQQQKK